MKPNKNHKQQKKNRKNEKNNVKKPRRDTTLGFLSFFFKLLYILVQF